MCAPGLRGRLGRAGVGLCTTGAPAREVPLNLRIVERSLDGSALGKAYLSSRPEALRFFSGDPFQLSSYEARLKRLRERFDRADRERTAAALRPTSDGARRRLERFVEEGGAVVTTGQQAGLFTGPLYTIYKALTTVRLARALEEALGTIVLPVFWVASEDHDWEEIDHVHVVDDRDVLRRLHLPSVVGAPVPVKEQPLSSDVETTLDELTQLVGYLGGDTAQLQVVRAAYRPGVGAADAFRLTIEELFSRFDLLVTDAADPALKQASIPVLEGALEDAAEQERAVTATGEELLAGGFSVQVPVIRGATNLFYHGPGGRERLLVASDGYRARETMARLSRDDLRDLLSQQPGRVSPNVLLRPVVESWVFPVLAYVAGPGEISYWAQTGRLFGAYGLEMPLVYPRASFTLVEPRVEHALRNRGLSLDDLERPRHDLLEQWARDAEPEGVSKVLARLRREITDGFAELSEAARTVDATLQGPMGTSRDAALREIARSERKIRAHMKRRAEEVQRQIDRARTHLRPLDGPQERTLNVFPYFAIHGAELLDELLEKIVVPWAESPGDERSASS